MKKNLRDLDILNAITDDLTQGWTISESLKKYYSVRHVIIPFSDKESNKSIYVLDLQNRHYNALLRNDITTLGELMEYDRPLIKLRTLGKIGAITILEKLLDYMFEQLTVDEALEFLCETVEANRKNLK